MSPPSVLHFRLSRRVLVFCRFCFLCLLLLLAVGDGCTVSSDLGLLAGHTHCREGLAVLHLVRDINQLWSRLGVVNWLDGALQLCDVCGLALLQDDQVAQVRLKSGNVQVEGFLGLVVSAVVDGNSDSAGVSGADSGTLELLKGEATSETDLGGVFLGWAVHDRSELVEWGWCDGGGPGSTRQSAALLLACLVEGELDLEWTTRRLEVLLVAMDIWDDIVVLDHLEILFLLLLLRRMGMFILTVDW
mmetsp:Transcript_9269/g.25071  ORF Transcript_9269/g.25071 Transcript_9269/m.25071 type:complete len:246 (+) Transcript_9269:1127-1864(+)